MSLKLSNYFCAVLLLWWIEQLIIEAILQVEYQRIESKNTPFFDFGTTRIRKYNHTHYALNGIVDQKIDLDNSYIVTMDLSRSTGGATFVSYPFKVPPTGICDYLNGSYKFYQHIYKEATNLPQVGDEGMCPAEKKKYIFNNLMLHPSVFPTMFPDGNWLLPIVVKRFNETDPVINIKAYFRVLHT